MPHPHTSHSVKDVDQLGTIIERIHTAMRTLDQLIIRTHKLNTEFNNIPDHAHQAFSNQAKTSLHLRKSHHQGK